ncbi:MAG: PhoH family protein [SAR324 cluster bacterium]|nr:PhoH family protein [SAR324 cluster bacterium]
MPENMTFVIDTNVLLYDPDALNAYPEEEIVLPIVVIEEIDKFKGVLSETGRNARKVSQLLDQYRQLGNLSEGITLPNNGRLKVMFTARMKTEEFRDLDLNRASNQVLAAAYQLHSQGKPLVLITQDVNLRVRANALGIRVAPYEEHPVESIFYKGIIRHEVCHSELESYRKGRIFEHEAGFHPNEGVLLVNENDAEDFELWRFDAEQGLTAVSQNDVVWGTSPRNPEQCLALDLLLNPEIPVVTMVGKAGTGKTLLALAAGLQMTLMENLYNKLLVSRPIFPMGRDLGYLPGEIQDKLAPWMQPIFDNLELLIGSPSKEHKPRTKGYQELLDQSVLVIEPLTYIRGRSIPHQYMIVDEAQNLTPHEIKTIITRAGEGTKIILTGDPHQIDNPYVNVASNGLSYVVERFKSHKLAGHVTLLNGERSSLAELAANIL